MQIRTQNYSNSPYTPSFNGNLSKFTKKLDHVLEIKKDSIPCDDLVDLKDTLVQSRKNITKKHRLLGQGWKGEVYQIDEKYALKTPAFFRQGFKLPFFNNGFSRHLKCYYGDQIATFGDYGILKNIGKHTPVGIPLSMSRNATTLSTEMTRYYEKDFLPMFASLPQKAFDDIAKDCQTLNHLEDSNTGLRYIFDFANPNNFVIKGKKILITDEIICNEKVCNTTADLLRAMVNYKEFGVKNQYSEKALPHYREIYKKVILAGIKEGLPLGVTDKKYCWIDATETLCKANQSADEVISTLADLKYQHQDRRALIKATKEYLDTLFAK